LIQSKDSQDTKTCFTFISIKNTGLKDTFYGTYGPYNMSVKACGGIAKFGFEG
jgi:hypothetical protein